MSYVHILGFGRVIHLRSPFNLKPKAKYNNGNSLGQVKAKSNTINRTGGCKCWGLWNCSEAGPNLRKLVDKHGDISDSCTLTKRLKTIPIFIFCSTVKSMAITDKMIFTWWCSFEFVNKAGFTIDFVFDHLKKIVKARYGTDTETYKRSPFYKLHVEMAQLSQEIDELNGMINKRREKMADLEKKQLNIIYSHRSERSRLEAKHLSEALEFRRKNATNGFL